MSGKVNFLQLCSIIFLSFLFLIPSLYSYPFDDESLTERYEIVGAISGSYNETEAPSGVAIIRDKTLNHTLTIKMQQKLPGFPGFRLVLIDRGRLLFKNDTHQLITLRKAGFQGERVSGYPHYANNQNFNGSNAGDTTEFSENGEGFIVDDDSSDSPVPQSIRYRQPINQVPESDRTSEKRIDGIPPSMRMGFGQNNKFLQNLPKNIEEIKENAQKFRDFSIPANNLPPSIKDGSKNPELGSMFYKKNAPHLGKGSKG